MLRYIHSMEKLSGVIPLSLCFVVVVLTRPQTEGNDAIRSTFIGWQSDACVGRNMNRRLIFFLSPLRYTKRGMIIRNKYQVNKYPLMIP